MSIDKNIADDVLVVGGAVIGLAIALELVSRQIAVTHVFPSAGDTHSASRAAGAMLGAFGELSVDDGPLEESEMDFRVAAQRAYPQWLRNITDLSGADVFESKGTFIVANNQGIRDRDSIWHMKNRRTRATSQPSGSSHMRFLA